MFKNIVPANNIFWVHELKLEQTQDETNFLSFKRHLPGTVIFARHLTDLYFATHKISLDCDENATKFVDCVFKKHFQNIMNHIDLLDKSILSLPEYYSNHFLVETHKNLVYLHKNIIVEQQKILSFQQENINSL